MVAFIKRRSDFKTVASANVSAWDVPLASTEDDAGSVVLVGEQASRGSEGDFLILDGQIWVIGEISYDKGQAQVKVEDILSLFERSLFYTAPGAGVKVEDWIKGQIEQHYKNCTDRVYALPYLDITADGETSWYSPDIDDSGLYVLRDYIETVHRLYGVQIDAFVTGDRLCLDVERRTRNEYRVVFTDGTAQLISEAYSRKSVAKITTVQGATVMDWYLSSAGVISNTPPESRVAGEWKMLVLKDRDVAADKVAAQFAKNSCSHKVEFMSTRAFALYDNVQLRLGESVVSSYISFIGTASGDNRFRYKTGELKTKLTETVKGVIKIERNSGNHLR